MNDREKLHTANKNTGILESDPDILHVRYAGWVGCEEKKKSCFLRGF